MLSEITSIVGLAGLILSIGLLAWQTRAVAEQTKISNNIAGASVASSANAIREFYMIFMDYPRLRPYFYNGKPCPRYGHQRMRVITLAEVLADELESILFGYKIVPSSGYVEPWTSYCQYMLEVSPTLRDLISTYPNWWPALHAMLAETHPRVSTFLSPVPDLLEPIK